MLWTPANRAVLPSAETEPLSEPLTPSGARPGERAAVGQPRVTDG
jgi:hypothetical protein